jgi:hypothetical protein
MIHVQGVDSNKKKATVVKDKQQAVAQLISAILV